MSQDPRETGVDAARTVAMLGVIVAHALVAYAVTPIGWAVTDRSGSLAVDGAIWIARAFLMPTFFLLAGHLAVASLTRRGVRGFVGSRARRLLVVLVVAVVPVSLAMNALWDWGSALSPRSVVAASVPTLEGSESWLTLGHLWYIHYLIAFCAVLAATWSLRSVAARLPAAARLALVGVAVAAPLVAAEQLQLDTPLGFAIDPGFALAYGAFFAWGVGVDLRRLAALAPLFAIAAVAAFAIVVPDLMASADGATPRLGSSVASAVFSVALTGAFTGGLLRIRRSRRALRFLARATYWTYIVHLPLVVLLQVAFSQLDWPAGLEVSFIVLAAVAVSLGSYLAFIRPTVLARFVG